ncbi:MAG: O-antigen ligase family protein [Chloroflexi bacterium]|nr:O-antigen ligase family protein [Chloroflexota bacterium]
MMQSLARGLVRFEIPALTAIYLYFVISDTVPLAAWILLALIWLARAWTTRQLIAPTAFNLPILVLLALLPINLAVSVDWSLSLPKVSGILLSVAFFFAVATQRDRDAAQLWLAIACGMIALAGLIGTDWAQSKIISASFIYDQLPRAIQNIPRSLAGGFSRNGVGGTLALTIPFLFALIITKQNAGEKSPLPPRPPALRRMFVIASAFALSLGTLALTQSRGGILGTLVGLLAVALWRERRVAWVIGAGALALIAGIALGYGDAISAFVLRMDAGAGTFASRLEVWSRGVMMVQDFPYTGIGIGTYNPVAHALYPFFIAAPDEVVAHAHNNFLQVAVDLGILGLIAYTALLTVFVIGAMRAYRAQPDARALIVGVFAGMLAHQTFGLLDAFMLGTKPGVLMWLYFALVAAMTNYHLPRTNRQ